MHELGLLLSVSSINLRWQGFIFLAKQPVGVYSPGLVCAPGSGGQQALPLSLSQPPRWLHTSAHIHLGKEDDDRPVAAQVSVATAVARAVAPGG